MPPTDISPHLLDLPRNAVVAPAGCGKTHLIAESLRTYAGPTPVLILTHTNAGVAALRQRLTRLRVSNTNYRLATLDGWAMWLGRSFPQRSGLSTETLEMQNPKNDYPVIRDAARFLLASGDVADILRATYKHVIVDEYQDCDVAQHEMVCLLADTLPTCVLGDPLQAIFGFGRDPLPSWHVSVCASFPVAHTLNRPWRWINEGSTELGEWLLDARRSLEAGGGLDLTGAPPTVRWFDISGPTRRQQQLAAARLRLRDRTDSALILADSKKPSLHRTIASQVPGAVTVENVDLRDFVEFADVVDFARGESLVPLVRFADSVLTKAGGSELLQRVDALLCGSARNPATPMEAIAIKFLQHPSPERAAELFEALNRLPGVRLVRPQMLHAAFRALNMCAQEPGLALGAAARRVRDELRAGGRTVVGRAVGSTLLLKGLEADIAIVLDADSMDAHHLYVAITRGARLLVICSNGRTISAPLPRRP
jgi:DNA helicase-2/ATP-dependent DNA helicase PcrA